jgi:hypothetical protein
MENGTFYDRFLALYRRLEATGYTKLMSRYPGTNNCVYFASLTTPAKSWGILANRDFELFEYDNPADNAFTLLIEGLARVRIVRTPEKYQEREIAAINEKGEVIVHDPHQIAMAVHTFLTINKA